jgi:hypothetical protein
MKGNQFNTLISILYVGYVLMQAPSYVLPCYPCAASLKIHKQHFLRSHEKAIAIPLKLHGNMGCYHLVHWYVDFSFDQHHLTRVVEGMVQTLVSTTLAVLSTLELTLLKVSCSSDLALASGICRGSVLSWGCIPSFAMV